MTSRKSIFITGAASGIGRETALLFAKKGWFTGIYDINEEALRLVAEEIGADSCCYGKLDVTSPDSYEAAVARFGEATGGKMDALFNCAGIMYMGAIEDVSLEQQLRTMRINVEGIIIGIYASLPLLKKSGNAVILSMSSASALYGVPDLAIYSASKFAVRGLTEALNIELEKHHIHTTDIMPLYVNTGMISSQKTKAGSLDMFGAKLTPHQIAACAWRAVTQKNKVHWVPTIKLKVLKLLSRYFPLVERSVMKFISRK
ncbi:MAG: SDR family oxidoreductase [Balneolales bacterium]|nr:SDR family oxidoreductase [Balneolales bacterium]